MWRKRPLPDGLKLPLRRRPAIVQAVDLPRVVRADFREGGGLENLHPQASAHGFAYATGSGRRMSASISARSSLAVPFLCTARVIYQSILLNRVSSMKIRWSLRITRYLTGGPWLRTTDHQGLALAAGMRERSNVYGQSTIRVRSFCTHASPSRAIGMLSHRLEFR